MQPHELWNLSNDTDIPTGWLFSFLLFFFGFRPWRVTYDEYRGVEQNNMSTYFYPLVVKDTT